MTEGQQLAPGDARWWDASKRTLEPHEIVHAVMGALKPYQQRRREEAKTNALYYGVDLESFGFNRSSDQNTEDDAPDLVFPVAENVIDTLLANTCKNRVVPFAKTVRGKFSARRRARDFNNWIEGVFSECGVFDNDPLWVTSALLFDAGVAKVLDEDDKVTVEFVFPWDIAVDPFEARHGKPRTLYQVHYVDRRVLWEDFRGDRGKRDARREIEQATRAYPDDGTRTPTVANDMLRVVEAWHLASSDAANDGRYVMCLDNATLVEREWKGRFPFAFLHRKRPIAGMWSPGLMRRLIAPQKEHDTLSTKLQESHDVIGVPRLLVPRDAKIEKAHIDDVPGTLIEYDGPQPPTDWNALPAHPTTYEYRTQVAEEMLQFSGVSAMSAQSEKPAGITAARALQVLDDVESIRNGPFNRNRDKFYVEIAELVLDTARDIVERNGKYVVPHRGKRNVTYVDLAKVDIGKDTAVVEIWPSNLLAKTPAAKEQQLEDWLKMGAIDIDRFRQLSEIPDIESEADYAVAPQDAADRTIEQALEGRTVVVEPFHPHELIFQRGVLAYDHELAEGADPNELDALRSLLADCQAQIAKKAPPPPPPGAVPPGAPPPMPGAPPPPIPGAPAPPQAA